MLEQERGGSALPPSCGMLTVGKRLEEAGGGGNGVSFPPFHSCRSSRPDALFQPWFATTKKKAEKGIRFEAVSYCMSKLPAQSSRSARTQEKR